jgi:hypothetical protein
VAESVPALELTQLNFVPETLYYNENIKVNLKAVNFSKKTAIDFSVHLKIDYENAFTVREEVKVEGLELEY